MKIIIKLIDGNKIVFENADSCKFVQKGTMVRIYCYRSPYWTPYDWSITTHDANLSNTVNTTQLDKSKVTLTSNNFDI